MGMENHFQRIRMVIQSERMVNRSQLDQVENHNLRYQRRNQSQVFQEYLDNLTLNHKVIRLYQLTRMVNQLEMTENHFQREMMERSRTRMVKKFQLDQMA